MSFHEERTKTCSCFVVVVLLVFMNRNNVCQVMWRFVIKVHTVTKTDNSLVERRISNPKDIGSSTGLGSYSLVAGKCP